MPIINLGVLAHVDAGKTSLTERILFQAGVIDEPGRVDHGTTVTDTLDLERRRGITIQSAVVSFTRDDLKVNIIDTPGHADFIAEVDRSLGVLDAAVLVISAVEGVQPQTRRLAAAIRTFGLPLIIVVNKIDRVGARDRPLLTRIGERLDVRVLAMSHVTGLGSRDAQVMNRRGDSDFAKERENLLAEVSDAFLRRYFATGGAVPADETERYLHECFAADDVVPVAFTSALTGAGVDLLMDGLCDWLKPAPQPHEPLSGIVFKIQRTPKREKVAVVRLFSGVIRVRDPVPLVHPGVGSGFDASTARVTGIDRFVDGKTQLSQVLGAGDVARLHGLHAARIGNVIGTPPVRRIASHFPPATLESVVRPIGATTPTAMVDALNLLAEQDPFIDVHLDERGDDVSVRLFGEMQKEVIEATLAADHDVAVAFSPSVTVCIEHVVGTGSAVEYMGDPANPFVATVGIQIVPGPVGSGVTFSRPSGALPLAYYDAIEAAVYETLRQGLCGWEVVDCRVSVMETGYSAPVTVAADFRNLTPLVAMAALREAGTMVQQPIERFTLEVPVDVVGAALSLVNAGGGRLEATTAEGDRVTLAGTIPTDTLAELERQMPGISRGEGAFSSDFAGYTDIRGTAPVRQRRDNNPLHRKEYLARVSQRQTR